MKLLATIALLCLLGSTSIDAKREGVPSDPKTSSATTKHMQKIAIARRGSLPSASGTAEHFTGTVHVNTLFTPNDPLSAAGASITSEPGARTAWHTHH